MQLVGLAWLDTAALIPAKSSNIRNGPGGSIHDTGCSIDQCLVVAWIPWPLLLVTLLSSMHQIVSDTATGVHHANQLGCQCCGGFKLNSLLPMRIDTDPELLWGATRFCS